MTNAIRRIGFSLLVWLSGCSRFIDQQPTPDHGPSTSRVTELVQMYPQAKDMAFATLLPNQLWRVTFAEQGHRYEALAGAARILSVDQRVEGALADSIARILDPTVVAGGRFSQPRVRHYAWNRTTLHPNGQFINAYAVYTWQGQRYTAYWSIAWPPTGKPFYNLYLLPYQPVAYETQTGTDLPQAIQASLRQQGLILSLAEVQLDDEGGRRYSVAASESPSAPVWVLIYDNEGTLLAATSNATAEQFTQLERLPPAIGRYLQRPELAGFGLSGYAGRHTHGTLVTYSLTLRKDKQYWEMLFTADGQLISRRFLVVGSF